MKDKQSYYKKLTDTGSLFSWTPCMNPAWRDGYIIPMSSNSIASDLKVYQEKTSLLYEEIHNLQLYIYIILLFGTESQIYTAAFNKYQLLALPGLSYILEEFKPALI